MKSSPSQLQQRREREEASAGSAGGIASTYARLGVAPSVNPVAPTLAQRWTSCLSHEPVDREPPREILIGVLRGEGIGSEVIQCALDVLGSVAAATRLQVRTREGGLIGRDAERSCGATLPDAVIGFCRDVFADGGAILNGPGGGRYVYELRKQLDLFLKISPIQSANGVADASSVRPELLRNIDILVAREGTAGAYQGEWTTQQDPGEGRKAGHFFGYTEWQVRRFLQASARLARMRRGNLTVVWKESGVPSISALWRDCAAEAAEGSGVEWSMVDVDLMAYRLVQEAPAFDVIAAPNLFGDVLADLGAVLLGSRGASYSGNFTGRGEAVYQTNHGAAYHLAGSDQANPAGQILSLAMMLRETFGLGREAEAVEQALRSVWSEGWRTADVAGPGTRVVGTRELGARVAEHAAAIVREGCEPGCEVG